MSKQPSTVLPPLTTRTLLDLAVPSAIFTFLTNGYRVVDQYFIQSVSTAAQAAIGSSVFVLILFYASFQLIAAGAGPLVARATGAGEPDRRREVIGSSLAGALVLAIVVTLLGALAAPIIAQSLGLEGEAASECVRYLRALSWTILPLVLTPLLDQSFISMGNARTPMMLHGLSLLLNIILTPLLIHTAGLGIVGAALASNFSRAIATALEITMLRRMTGLHLRDIRFTPELRRVLRIGAPLATSVMAYALVYWALLKTSISPLGPQVNAALGIGFSALEGVTFPVYNGLSLAIASLVGRYLGAKRVDLAKAAIRTAFPVATLSGSVASVLFWLGGSFFTGLFTSEPAVHQAATQYAVILGASQLCLSWETLANGILAGSGDTKTLFRFSAPINVARVPLAWIFAFPFGFGAAGIWWAINVTTYAKAALKGLAAMRGRWAEIEP